MKMSLVYRNANELPCSVEILLIPAKKPVLYLLTNVFCTPDYSHMYVFFVFNFCYDIFLIPSVINELNKIFNLYWFHICERVMVYLLKQIFYNGTYKKPLCVKQYHRKWQQKNDSNAFQYFKMGRNGEMKSFSQEQKCLNYEFKIGGKIHNMPTEWEKILMTYLIKDLFRTCK